MKDETDPPLKEILLVEVHRLDAKITGIVTGVVGAAALFIATNWLVIKGGPNVGGHLKLLAQFFPGYSVTFLGSLIGAAYAFIAAFFAGYLVTALYNRLVRRTSRKGSRG